MEVLENVLSEGIVQRFGWVLVHFVWQAAAVALVLAIVLRALRKSSANERYIVACLALVAVVVLPAVTMSLIPVDESYSPVEAAAAPASVPDPVAIISTPVNELPVDTEITAGIEMPVVEIEPGIESIAAAPKIPLSQRITEVLEPKLPYVVVAWFVGVFGLSVWYLGGWTQLQRLRRKMVKPVDESLQRKLKKLQAILRVNGAIDIVESALVQSPTVIGWLKPVILLPASVLTGFSTEQIEAILAHELAHIKRCDYLVNMLQTCVEILGFYHPAVWWISKKIRAERENCCDDIAVKISGDKIAYAKTLALFEGIKPNQPDLAVAASGGCLFQRICRLIQKDSTNVKADWKPSVIAAVLVIALLIPTGFALTASSEEKTSDALNSRSEEKTAVKAEEQDGELTIYSGLSSIGYVAKRIYRDDKGRIIKTVYYNRRHNDKDSKTVEVSKWTPTSEKDLQIAEIRTHKYDRQGREVRVEHYSPDMKLNRIMETLYDSQGLKKLIVWSNSEEVREYEIRYSGKRSISHLYFDDSGTKLISARGVIPEGMDLAYGWGEPVKGVICAIAANKLIAPQKDIRITSTVRNLSSKSFNSAIGGHGNFQTILRDADGNEVPSLKTPAKARKNELQSLGAGQIGCLTSFELGKWYADLNPGKYSLTIKRRAFGEGFPLVSNTLPITISGESDSAVLNEGINGKQAAPLNDPEREIIGQLLELVKKVEKDYPNKATHWPVGPGLYHVDSKGEVTVWHYRMLWNRSKDCDKDEVGWRSSLMDDTAGYYYLPDGTPLKSRWSDRGNGIKDIRVNVGRVVGKGQRVAVIHRHVFACANSWTWDGKLHTNFLPQIWDKLTCAIIVRVDRPMRLHALWKDGDFQDFDKYDQVVIRDPGVGHITPVLSFRDESKASDSLNSRSEGKPDALDENQSVDRTFYFKLPLVQPRFHWKFTDKDLYLSGKLILRIIRDDQVNEIVVFDNGQVSKGWKALRTERGPQGNSMYFGFHSTTKYSTMPSDKVELELIAKDDLDGIGRLQTGILKAGTHKAKGKFKIYKSSQDRAFIEWQDKWLLDITSEKGWWTSQTGIFINDNGTMRPLTRSEKKRIYAAAHTRSFHGHSDLSLVENITGKEVDGNQFRNIRMRKSYSKTRIDITEYTDQNRKRIKSKTILLGKWDSNGNYINRIEHSDKKVFVENGEVSIIGDTFRLGRIESKLASTVGVLSYLYDNDDKEGQYKTATTFGNEADVDQFQIINLKDNSIVNAFELSKADWRLCRKMQWYNKGGKTLSKSIEYADFNRPVEFKTLADPGDSGYLLPYKTVRRYFDDDGNEEKAETLEIVDASMASSRRKHDYDTIRENYGNDFDIEIPDDYKIIDKRKKNIEIGDSPLSPEDKPKLTDTLNSHSGVKAAASFADNEFRLNTDGVRKRGDNAVSRLDQILTVTAFGNKKISLVCGDDLLTVVAGPAPKSSDKYGIAKIILSAKLDETNSPRFTWLSRIETGDGSGGGPDGSSVPAGKKLKDLVTLNIKSGVYPLGTNIKLGTVEGRALFLRIDKWEKTKASGSASDLIHAFMKYAKDGDPKAGELFAGKMTPECVRLLDWWEGKKVRAEIEAEFDKMRSEFQAGLTTEQKQFYSNVRIWQDRGKDVTHNGNRGYVRLLNSKQRKSWIRRLLLQKTADGLWQIGGLHYGHISNHAYDFLANSPATHPAWGEVVEFDVSAEDIRGGCYVDFDKRRLYNAPSGGASKRWLSKIGIDGKCAPGPMSGRSYSGGFKGIDLKAASAVFIRSLITPLNAQLMSTQWSPFGIGGGGPFIFKTREGNFGIMIVGGSAEDFTFRFKMLNPSYLKSQAKVIKSMRSDPSETAAYVLACMSERNLKFDPGEHGFVSNPDVLKMGENNGFSQRLDNIYMAGNSALAITSRTHQDDYHRLALFLEKEKGQWTVNDIQVEKKSQEGTRLKKFLKDY